MKCLNILDIQRKLKQRTEKTIACYEKILEFCHKRIMFNCERRRVRFFFEVPEYIFGYPIFDINDAIRFVVNALTSNGFLAIYYFPKYIYVSWDTDEISKYKQQTSLSNQLEHKESSTIKKVGVDFKYKPSGKLSLQID
jgi:Family of unknown function (DUF5759)